MPSRNMSWWDFKVRWRNLPHQRRIRGFHGVRPKSCQLWTCTERHIQSFGSLPLRGGSVRGPRPAADSGIPLINFCPRGSFLALRVSKSLASFPQLLGSGPIPARVSRTGTVSILVKREFEQLYQVSKRLGPFIERINQKQKGALNHGPLTTPKGGSGRPGRGGGGIKSRE